MSVEIPLTRGLVAIVDDDDAAALTAMGSWVAEPTRYPGRFYAIRRELRSQTGRKQRRTIFMHRVILGLEYGDKRHADHINHDTLDNRRVNLRPVTNSQNQRNRVKPLPSHNTSGYLGVRWRRDKQRWEAKARANGPVTFIGYFATAEEGVAARRAFLAERGLH